jgi:clan AA aspartic protease
MTARATVCYSEAILGLTFIDLDIANPAQPKQKARIEFLIDTGAFYSVVPASLLRKLGIRPHSKRTFTLADGSKITRQIGDVQFRFDGRQGASPVIFGQKDDSVLLGSVSLGALGLMIDPLKRELRPLPMILASLDTRR